MFGQFTPVGDHSVEFAKAYRAQQLRDAESSRLATACRPPRRPPSRLDAPA